MGQAESSTELFSETNLCDHRRPHNHFSHVKSGTGTVISSARKRNIERLEDSTEMCQKIRRVLSTDAEEEHLEISEVKTRELLRKMLLNLIDPDKLLPEKSKRGQKLLPKFEKDHFRIGDESTDQEFVIYMRLDGCDGVWNALLERYKSKSGSKFEISIILQSQDEVFFERQIPFEPNPNIDFKFSVRCNKGKFGEFLKSLSSRLQVLMSEEEEPEFSKPVLESEEILFGSLVHTMASLSLCTISDVKGRPEPVYDVSCYVFLDLSPLSPKNAPSFCSNCTEGSHLMTVFNEVRRSSGKIIDLTGPQVTATSKKVDPADINNFKDDNNECMDLRIKKKTTEVATKTVETCCESPPPIVTKQSDGISNNIVNTAASQTPEKSVKETTSKAESKLRVSVTAKPIKRKHKARSRELYLMNKVKEMEKRLLALKKMQEQTENEMQGSTSGSDVVVEASVPPSVISQPSPSPPTFVLNTTAHIVPLNVAPSSSSAEEKLYKCPENGCTESFNNKSSLSRHRKKVHFPNKLHKCNNCGHAFPRPYMLQRHLDHKVCLSKDVSKSMPITVDLS